VVQTVKEKPQPQKIPPKKKHIFFTNRRIAGGNLLFLQEMQENLM